MKRIKFAFSLSTIGVFFFGLALGCMFFFGLESQNEHNFLDRVVSKIDHNVAEAKNVDQEEQFVKEAVHYTNYMASRRTEIFSLTQDNPPLKQRFFHSPIRASIDGYGDCGGYSAFLMAILARKGYRVKPVQLKVNGNYGGHITVCVTVNGKPVVVDPLYDELFVDANGHLSDIRQVSTNWAFYQGRITNPKYREDYVYSNGYRFTNWDKYGALTRGAFGFLKLVGGTEWANNVSLHQYIMDTYYNGFVLACIYVFLFLLVNSGKILSRIRHNYLKDLHFTFQRTPRRGSLQHGKAA